jgi:putative molybdopterin biosynthesis protein
MNDSRHIYLKMKSVKDARQKIFDLFSPKPASSGELIAVTKSVGRVLAQPVFARLSSPGFHAAAMDGAAVRAKETFGASELNPKILKTGSQAVFVNTGNILPANTDAVIMIEDIQIQDENHIQIEAPAFPWQYVRKMGEDIVATEQLFARHHKITPYCLGALLAGGISEVPVLPEPHLFLLPTGPELVEHGKATEEFAPGKVIESNSHVIGKMAEALGARFTRHDILADIPELIGKTVEKAAKSEEVDMILIMGGSSAGSEDFARRVIQSLGQVHVHGVAMMPGKPLVIGEINKKPAFGIPGYPISAIMAFEKFVAPVICAMLGQEEAEPETEDVKPTRKIAGRLGMQQFIRVKLGKVGQNIAATPLPRGAGTITSITEADGIIEIPADKEGIREDETVTARLINSRSKIENTIVAVGSHDNTIDVIADLLKARSDKFSLSSSHVGSMGGLMAIKKGLCHLAGSHLLDTKDGSYNISYIKKFLPDIPVRLVRLAEREQGIITAPGNPRKIKGIEDLTRDDIIFINRQAGSGTRVLLDYHLKKAGIDPQSIQGYENEEFTHMAVAVAVLGQSADAGLGILAAARALGLDFIPVATESYEFVIPEAYAGMERIRLLLEIIASQTFIKKIQDMGGYHTEKTGILVWKSH